jgi:spore maturation protein CgeB
VKIFVFGSSITSSYWNGAATYYRGIYKHLHALGHEIIFAEPDIYDRQRHRDAGPFPYVDVIVYDSPHDIEYLLHQASQADLVIKHSGVGAEDERLERDVLISCQAYNSPLVVFWDVDAPATLARLEENPRDPFRELVPQYDAIFTYGGGPRVCRQYLELDAKQCFPIYNALDPETHYPVAAHSVLRCDLAFVGNRLPDRERRVEEFLLHAAELAPEMTFVLGGAGWADKPVPRNVRKIGHVGTDQHNFVNSSARMVLNVNRDSMASTGFSPPTRVFEAAGAGACVITDAWAGIEQFFMPGEEILLASSAAQVAQHLRSASAEHAHTMGKKMRQRALLDHTYAARADQVDKILETLRHPAEMAA